MNITIRSAFLLVMLLSLSTLSSSQAAHVVQKATTTVNISIIPAPFTMNFQNEPLTLEFDGKQMYSPGTIKIREHRQQLTGWSVCGQLTTLSEDAKNEIGMYTVLSPIGQSDEDQIYNLDEKSIRTNQQFLLASSRPGSGRGAFLLRPFFSLDDPTEYSFSFTAL